MARRSAALAADPGVLRTLSAAADGSMRALSVAYLGLLLLDGLLSLADSVTSVDAHLSKWTTIALCLASLFVFVTGSVMSLVARFRPRWPVLLASGAYTLYFGSKLARAFMGSLQELGPAEQKLQNLEVVGVQLLLAAVCIIGLANASARLPRSRRRESSAATRCNG